jgi:acyl-CoA reductase-like NAD-dependent aldehyde dehydrogenase
MKHTWILTAITSLMLISSAEASPIVYTGINPEISPTANPFNESAIANFSGLTKKTKPSASTSLTEAQLLKQSVITGLSSTYQQLLTGSNPSAGTVNFGDGSTAVYSTVGNVRYITFYDLNGQSTQISFPLN